MPIRSISTGANAQLDKRCGLDFSHDRSALVRLARVARSHREIGWHTGAKHHLPLTPSLAPILGITQHGHVQFTISCALIVSTGSGTGTLDYQGKTYRLSVNCMPSSALLIASILQNAGIG
jgi:hypothetical protein